MSNVFTIDLNTREPNICLISLTMCQIKMIKVVLFKKTLKNIQSFKFQINKCTSLPVTGAMSLKCT